MHFFLGIVAMLSGMPWRQDWSGGRKTGVGAACGIGVAVSRPSNFPPGRCLDCRTWIERVNQAIGEKEEEKLRQSIRRGRPFGDEE